MTLPPAFTNLPCLFVLLAGAAAGFQEPAASFDRELETYKIYSRLMSPPETSHGANPRYLIARTTRVERWQPAVADCVKPPVSHTAQFREVLSDFEGRRKSEGSLDRKLSITKPYVLLSDPEVKEFQQERMYPRPPGQEQTSERFRVVIDLFTFSDVYFSKDGKLALVHMGTWCGGLCARYDWRVFEKPAGGEWVELRWPTCFVVAGGAPNFGVSGR